MRSTTESMAQTSGLTPHSHLLPTPGPVPPPSPVTSGAQWPQSLLGLRKALGSEDQGSGSWLGGPTAELPGPARWRSCSTLSRRMRRVPASLECSRKSLTPSSHLLALGQETDSVLPYGVPGHCCPPPCAVSWAALGCWRHKSTTGTREGHPTQVPGSEMWGSARTRFQQVPCHSESPTRAVLWGILLPPLQICAPAVVSISVFL